MVLDPCQQCRAGIVAPTYVELLERFSLYFDVATRLAREHTISLKCMLVHSTLCGGVAVCVCNHFIYPAAYRWLFMYMTISCPRLAILREAS